MIDRSAEAFLFEADVGFVCAPTLGTTVVAIVRRGQDRALGSWPSFPPGGAQCLLPSQTHVGSKVLIVLCASRGH